MALLAILALLMANILAASTPADAMPKRPGLINGCTAEQIQSPSSAPCIDQFEKDVLAGYAYPHHLMCDETGVYCCQGDGTRTFNCKKVSALKVQPGLISPIAPGVLQSAPQ